MLTQIEWWGGVIFVLGALTYRMVMGALRKATTAPSIRKRKRRRTTNGPRHQKE